MQCFHCGRNVRGTIHTRTSYEVDYYLLHTGQTQWEFFLNPKQDLPPFRYLKLTQPIDVLTCVQCYARPEIRQILEDDINGRRPLIEALTKAPNQMDANATG
jgi:hypothetical protein